VSAAPTLGQSSALCSSGKCGQRIAQQVRLKNIGQPQQQNRQRTPQKDENLEVRSM
jgi:hypothetical protein